MPCSISSASPAVGTPGLALDDFGMGYNSEAILVDTPLQYVKLDMSIIRHIDIDKAALSCCKI